MGSVPSIQDPFKQIKLSLTPTLTRGRAVVALYMLCMLA